MADKRFPFSTKEQAARRCGRRGWQKKTTDELSAILEQPRNWTGIDSANLSRIATALEGIRAELKRVRKTEVEYPTTHP